MRRSRNNRNQEALEFEWDPEDSRRFLPKGSNPHQHPKMADLVKRWYLAGDSHGDIERKSRNAARRLFRGNSYLGNDNRRNRNDNRRPDNRRNDNRRNDYNSNKRG